MRALFRAPALILATLLHAACGSDTVAPDVTVADLVGDWSATELVLSNPLDSSQRVDVIGLGADFFLNIQPSGGYTSSISFEGQGITELGQLEVEGDQLILRVEFSANGPRVDTASFELDGNTLTLDGRTIFDFDLNGVSQIAKLEATLVR